MVKTVIGNVLLYGFVAWIMWLFFGLPLWWALKEVLYVNVLGRRSPMFDHANPRRIRELEISIYGQPMTEPDDRREVPTW